MRSTRRATTTIMPIAATFIAMAFLGGCVVTSAPSGTPPERAYAGLWVPSPPEVIAAMLELAEVGPDDVVYDLGSGEGEIVIAAARRYGVRAVGVELDHERVQSAEKNAADAGVTSRVTFVERDLFEVDISEATVVTLYLFPELMRRLQPKLLRELRPGTRIVAHDFALPDWRPEQTIEVRLDRVRRVYLWTVPPRR
jgi:SAM-dependent methyltransferase